MRVVDPGGQPAWAGIPLRTRHSLPVFHMQTKYTSACHALIGTEGKETGGLGLLSIFYVPGLINDSEKQGPLSGSHRGGDQHLNLSLSSPLHHDTTREFFAYVETAYTAPSLSSPPEKTSSRPQGICFVFPHHLGLPPLGTFKFVTVLL